MAGWNDIAALTPQQRLMLEREARLERLMMADPSFAPPGVQSTMAGLGPAPLDEPGSMVPVGIGSGDMPVEIAPYGVSPVLYDPASADALIDDLQLQDETRRAGRRSPEDKLALANAGMRDIDHSGYSRDPRGGVPEVLPGSDVIPISDLNVFAPHGRGLLPTDTGLLPPAEQRTLRKAAGTPTSGYEPPLPPAKQKPDVKAESTLGEEGTGKEGRISTSGLAEDADDAEKELNWIQRMARDKLGMDDDQRSDLARALIMGGAATMAGDSPYALQNIGKGVAVGADTYFGEQDDREQEAIAAEEMAMARELHDLKVSKIQQDLAAGEISIEQAEKELADVGKFDPYEGLSKTHKSILRAQILHEAGLIPDSVWQKISGIDPEMAGLIGE